MPDFIGPVTCFICKLANLQHRRVLALAGGVLACCSVLAADAPVININPAVRPVANLAASLAANPVIFSHKDWELACDNTRTCRALGYQRDNDALSLALLLTREAGVATPVRAQLMLGSYGNEAPPTPPSLNVLVNGRALGAMPVDQNSGIGELNAAQTAAVLLALPKVADVQFVSGKNRWQLSGDGAAAVLLRMDEVQGRLGTATALVKKGTASDDGVLPRLPLPVVQQGVIDASKPIDKRIAAVIRPLLTVNKYDYCPELTEPATRRKSAEPVSIVRINSTQLLVSTLCWRAAYNTGDGVWLINDKPPYQPQLIVDFATDVSADIISAGQKGRGLGDCLSYNEWVWNGVYYAHTRAGTTGMCKLVAGGGAWELPTIVSNVIPAAK